MEKILQVEGMMCPHCEAHVKKALESLPGVAEATPNHKDGTVRVILTGDVEDAVLASAVTSAGYTVK